MGLKMEPPAYGGHANSGGVTNDLPTRNGQFNKHQQYGGLTTDPSHQSQTTLLSHRHCMGFKIEPRKMPAYRGHAHSGGATNDRPTRLPSTRSMEASQHTPPTNHRPLYCLIDIVWGLKLNHAKCQLTGATPTAEARPTIGRLGYQAPAPEVWRPHTI